jgi:hypothetical protein
MFDATEDDFLDFEKVENPLSQRPDLHAFMLLDRLVPGKRELISASEHDEFYLSVDCEELSKVATLEIVRELHRCGVRYSAEYDCLCMFA